jgi:hypothetical protein
MDIILDTNILSDFIDAYYKFDVGVDGNFEDYKTISPKLCKLLNSILNCYRFNGTLEEGIVGASAFAFIEIARKFEIITELSYSIEKFKAFIESPPEWFVISPLNNDLFLHLNLLPANIQMQDGKILPLEWADTIHVATGLNRDDKCLVAVTDGRLARLEQISHRIFIID